MIRIDDKESLFESNAIAEYLDETIQPRLHPEDPLERAKHRAWTDYVPTFADVVTATAYAKTEDEYNKEAAKIPVPFERLEKALEKQGKGPYFAGAKYSLVDAAYAPFLQRYAFLDRVKTLGCIEKFPRLKAWSEALMARPSTHSFPEAEFEAMYRENLKRRNMWVSKFVGSAQVAAGSRLSPPPLLFPSPPRRGGEKDEVGDSERSTSPSHRAAMAGPSLPLWAERFA